MTELDYTKGVNSRMAQLLTAVREDLAEGAPPLTQRFVTDNDVTHDEFVVLCAFLDRACEEIMHGHGRNVTNETFVGRAAVAA